MSHRKEPLKNANGTVKALPLVTGEKYGRLTVGEKAWRKGHNWLWRCTCECGKEILAIASNLRSGNTQSCGCYRVHVSQAKATIHGLSNTRAYFRWHGMLQRCYWTASPVYAKYGGRGIAVCERWHRFENFFADMGEMPDGCSLDRVNNDGPYAPENCRWANWTEQARNRRNSIFATIGGETRTLAEWAEISGMPYGRIYTRKWAGWPDEHLLLARLTRRPKS